MENGMICVTAQPGQSCPKSGPFSGRIGCDTPVMVQNNRYYRRLIADGSLIEVKQDVSDQNTIETKTASKKKGV